MSNILGWHLRLPQNMRQEIEELAKTSERTGPQQARWLLREALIRARRDRRQV